MITFLQKIVSEKKESDFQQKKDLIPLLVKHLGQYKKGRSVAKTHASAVTKPSFCARQIRLMDVLEVKPKDEWIPAALQATFDMGHDVARHLTDQWFGDRVVGHWKCVACGCFVTWQSKPTVFCWDCKTKEAGWTYKEVEFFDYDCEVSGSVDLFLDLGTSRVTAVELKIMAPAEFEKIVAPLAEHRERTQLYLSLISASKSPFRGYVDTTHAKVLYVSRGHGKKNEAVGQVVPFKEFDVFASEETAEYYKAKGRDLKEARDKKVIPIVKLCENHNSIFAKGCPVAKQCFSGEYP